MERDRRATLGAVSALGGRGMTLAVSLVAVPLTLNYLGPERYGMWFTISSMIALLSFSDLGVGYGLLNAVTRSIAMQDFVQARRQISSSLVLLIFLAVLIAGLFIGTYPLIPWPQVLGVTSALATSEAAPAIAAFLAIFLVGLPLSVATQVRVARQEVYLVHATATIGNLVSLVALILVISTRQGVPALVVAMAGPPAIAAAANAAVLFRRNAPELMPSVWLADARLGLTLMRAGFLFLVLQMAMTVAFATDTLIIARLLGPDAVAEYGVAFRLFTIPIGLVAIGVSPLWPAYGEAIARGDIAWARTTLHRSLRAALFIAVPAAVLFVALGGWIISIWVGGAVTAPFLLLLGLGIWTVQTSVGQSVAMLLNGANEVRLQAVAAALMAIANLGLSIWLTARIGVAGVVWGTVITYGALVLVPMAAYVPGVLRRIGAANMVTPSVS
jgi:O-antigen/teichoic acid export membrane protein